MYQISQQRVGTNADKQRESRVKDYETLNYHFDERGFPDLSNFHPV